LCPLFRAIITGRESEQSLFVFALGANGRRIPMSVSVGPLHDQHGTVIGGIETFRDETQTFQDLEFSERIQRHLLPAKLPQSGPFRLDVRYYPRDMVGGDFYDVKLLDPNHITFLVADVRGHGVSGALYTMWLKSLEESLLKHAHRPRQFLAALNHELSRFIVDESFITAFYGVVDTRTGTVTYGNGGHPFPLHFHAQTQKITTLEAGELALGILGDEDYTSSSISLEPGDLLLCYTDGITEVFDAHNRMLGTEGLSRVLAELMCDGPDNLLDRLYERVMQYNGSVSFSDDVLLLSVKRLANE